jgi:hypothetical protein
MSVPNGTKFIGISANVDTLERKSALANSPSQVYTIEDIAESAGKLYKVYTALLSQVGSPSSAPIAIVLENTLSNPVIITRNSAGNYSITCSDFADTTKVYVELKSINLLSSSIPSQYYWFTVNPGEIVINSTYINLITNSITPTDFVLNKTPIEIRVYN